MAPVKLHVVMMGLFLSAGVAFAQPGDTSTGGRIEALRKERDDLRRRHAADARRLAFLDVEEKLMDTERQLNQARGAHDDKKVQQMQQRQGRLNIERRWLEES